MKSAHANESKSVSSRRIGSVGRFIVGLLVVAIVAGIWVLWQVDHAAVTDQGDTGHVHRMPEKVNETRDGKAIAVTGKLLQASKLSTSGDYQVTLSPLPDSIPMHELHAWQIKITEPGDGPLVQPSRLEVTGGMAAHGHGLPTMPQVRDYDSRAGFTIEGMRFNMAGDWFLQVDFTVNGRTDRASFAVVFNAAGKPVENTDTFAATDSQNQAQPDVRLLDWSASEQLLLQSLVLDPEKLRINDSGNAVVGSAKAARLGHRLFFDQRLSRSNVLSCATCHQPEHYFTDNIKTAVGQQPLDRNTPSVVGAASHRWLYWDGRRDSTWSQALVPMEAAKEMGSSRVAVAQFIHNHYADSYTEVFGALPQIPFQGLEVDANPLGKEAEREAWNKIAPDVKVSINRVFTNVGKALAAYQAQLLPAPGRFDSFVASLVAGDRDQAARYLSLTEQQGLKLFISAKTQCLNCHNTPLMTNRGFHNIGTGLNDQGEFDFGRMMGSQMVMMNEFNCRSRYSDDPDNQCQELDFINKHEITRMMRGAFRVPSLRGLSATSPYMHDGRYDTLRKVVEHYTDPPAHVSTSIHELPAIDEIDDGEIQALVEFLLTLGDQVAAEPVWLKAPTAE